MVMVRFLRLHETCIKSRLFIKRTSDQVSIGKFRLKGSGYSLVLVSVEISQVVLRAGSFNLSPFLLLSLQEHDL